MSKFSILLSACALMLATAYPAMADETVTLPAASTQAEHQPVQNGVPIGAQVTASTSAQIGAPMSGRLISFPFKDGDRFKAGAVLAAFQCDQQRATLLHAEAEVVKHHDVLSTQQQLQKLGSYSILDYKVAGSELKAAQADLSVAQATVALCEVRAPFSGRVSGAETRNYQFVQVGAPMLDILDDASLDVEAIVPSEWLVWVKPGTPFTVSIRETGSVYPAKVVRISGRVDAVSQTVKVYGRTDVGQEKLLPGMSGEATFRKNGG